MTRLPLRRFFLWCLAATLLLAVPAITAETPDQSAVRDKIIHAVRDHFGIPDANKITLTDLHAGTFPDYLETTVTVDNGKEKQSQSFYVSKNLHDLLAGNIFAIQAPDRAGATEKIVHIVHERYNVPESAKIALTEFHETIYPDYFALMITVTEGKEVRVRPFYISKDLHYLMDGSILILGDGPGKEIARLISLADQPSQGPAGAPVTLVEYSDLACPHCAKLQEEIESDIVPRHGDKLRVVYKEFPLVNIHDWALIGAIASQCTYQISPSMYVPFRTQVFKSQESLTQENSRDMLLHYAAEAGVDNMKLAACMDSKATLARVVADMLEGNALGVSSTPTSYVNGRIIVGAPVSTDFDKLIDEAAHDPK